MEGYPVASAEVAEAVVAREYVAEIRAVRYAEVRARVRGIVEEVAVDEGQHVEAGQRLFSIGARHLKQDLAAARAAAAATRAELQAARLEQENTQLLFDKNVVSAAPLGQVKARAEALEAKLQELKAGAGRAKVDMGYASVAAPFSGTINRIPNRAGSAVDEEELLTTIADTSEVYAYFHISERDYLRHEAEFQGDPSPAIGLKLELADGTRFPGRGVIDAVANEVERETGTITVRARFDNENGMLKHGSSAKVVLETTIPNAIVVPQASTFEIQGDVFVYAVDDHSLVHARKIVPRARLGRHFVVESGLTASDRYVTQGVQKLRDGTQIEVVDARADADDG